MELFLKRRLAFGWKVTIKEIKVRIGLGDIIQLWTILLPLGSLQRSSTILKLFFFVDFGKYFDMVHRKNL
jgi:hypothetical protein